jgi:two-component system OmpR family sensor kinase
VSLRHRVLLAVGVIAVSLVVVLVFLTRTTEDNLLRQVDEQLQDAVGPVRGVGERGPRRSADLSSLYVGVVDGHRIVTIVTPGLRGANMAVPTVTAGRAADAAATGEPFSVGSLDEDLRWRIQAVTGQQGRVTVIGLPLDTVDDAVRDLVAASALGALAILAALALVTVWVIRLGVRPVQQMTDVASAIAAGDLSRRVPEAEPGTEVGALGIALNAMLASIETSFDERTRAEERLRQFVADASHELRTPVATIRGYAELHRAGALPAGEALDDAMRRTEQEAIRMGGLVDDLLALARLDQGRPLDLAPVDLVAVARDAVADARAVDPGRAVSLHDTGPVVVRAEEAKVRQVVANLIGNAVVHTPSTAAVTVSVDREGGWGRLSVADDGPGMAPEVSGRAFERFYRADPSRSRHQGGSGLGLAIVDAIVRAHGGEVQLRSAPGAGTTVSFRLPLHGAATG